MELLSQISTLLPWRAGNSCDRGHQIDVIQHVIILSHYMTNKRHHRGSRVPEARARDYYLILKLHSSAAVLP